MGKAKKKRKKKRRTSTTALEPVEAVDYGVRCIVGGTVASPWLQIALGPVRPPRRELSRAPSRRGCSPARPPENMSDEAFWIPKSKTYRLVNFNWGGFYILLRVVYTSIGIYLWGPKKRLLTFRGIQMYMFTQLDSRAG